MKTIVRALGEKTLNTRVEVPRILFALMEPVLRP
jgi:hypothetical protein